MTKNLSISILLAFILISSAVAYVETTAAPCGSFKKLSDGRWSVAKPIKIEHGNESALLKSWHYYRAGHPRRRRGYLCGSATGLPDNKSCELAPLKSRSPACISGIANLGFARGTILRPLH